jgi:hypothetical protein
MIVKVSDLRTGDLLNSGTLITRPPFDSVKCPKGYINVCVTYSSGRNKTQQWRKSTTVRVVNREEGLSKSTKEALVQYAQGTQPEDKNPLKQ